MTLPPLPADWLAALRHRVCQPPRRARVPLQVQAGGGWVTVGSVEPDFLSKISLNPLPDIDSSLQKEEQTEERAKRPVWRLHGDPAASLARLAEALREAGLAGPWRNELLAVRALDESGAATVPERRVAVIERGAVRPLGIATHAVHLIGCAPDGRCWVQQRAWNKPTDPGLWDTLMGGMVPAADTLHDALARETWEEAGLRLDDLHAVVPGARAQFRLPSRDGQGAGYVVEDIDWFTCTVPAHLKPVNQDGEVAWFALLDRATLTAQLVQGAFTLEAALILTDWLAQQE